jgi:YD repeat-containing protein
MKMMGVVLVFFGTLFAGAAHADQITLKNGDRLTGTIVKSDAKTLIIKTEFAGVVTILWPAIDTISSAEPLHVGLNGGQMIVGPVTTSGGQVQIATQTAGVVTASKDSIQVIRSDSEEAAYDAAMDRLQHPHLLDFWGGLLDTGLSLTQGNSSTLTYTLSGKAVRRTDRDKITIYGTAVYGRDDNTSPSQTTADQIQGGFRVDVDVSSRWFAFGLTEFNYNALQHLDLQNVIAGGAGYHVVKTKNTSFDLSGGAGFNQQYFSSYSLANPTPPPPTLAFPAVTQRGADLVAGEELDTKLSSRTTFSENFTFYPGVGGPGGYRFTFNTTAATKLKNWLGWQITFADIYISNPPFGIKDNDLLLSTGLRLTFGKPAQ